MPSEHVLTGNFGVGTDQNGNDVVTIQTDPFTNYVVPLPDDLPPGAPPDAISARELLKRHLNKGVVTVPSGTTAIVPHL